MVPAAANTLCKEERLCGKTAVTALVSQGKWGVVGNLRYCWRVSGACEHNRIMVSVPKKHFKRAVKRNLLKRRMREAYRTQKQLLRPAGVDVLFAYAAADVADFAAIKADVAAILSRIDKKLDK